MNSGSSVVSKDGLDDGKDEAEVIHTHSGLNPDGLASRQLGHLLDIWEIKQAPLGLIVRRKHVLLPWFSEQPLHSDLALGQPIRSRPLIPVLLVDPAAVYKNSRGVLAL